MKSVEEILKEIKPGVDFQKEKELIKNNILTSFDIITLVANLSSEYDISIDVADIVPENFQSLEAIEKLIDTKRG
jgi:acyl carrier protein